MPLLPRLFFLFFLLFPHAVLSTDQEPPNHLATSDAFQGSLEYSNLKHISHLKRLYDGFDPFRRTIGINENFDPQTADPTGNLTCWGGFDPGIIEAGGIPGIDLTQVTAQAICAKPQYGGNLQFHIGGWCRVTSEGKEVVFDASQDAWPNRQLDTLEMKTFCLQRCYCDSSILPLLGPPQVKEYMIQYHPRSDTYMIQGQLMVGYPPSLPPKGSGTEPAIALAIVNQKQAVAPDVSSIFSTQYVSILPLWNVSCPGNEIPEWLPAGWTSSDFQGKAQRLCASVFNGGNPNANMGGLCLPSTRRGFSRLAFSMRGSKFLKFRNTFIPDPAFTPGPTISGLRIPEALQLWCYAQCTCDDIPDYSPSLTGDKVWLHMGGNSYEIDVSSGGVAVRAIQNGRRRKPSVYIPKGTTQQSAKNTCSADGGLDVCNSDNTPLLDSVLLDQPPGFESICGRPCPSSVSCSDPNLDPNDPFQPTSDEQEEADNECKCHVVESPPPGTFVFDPVSPGPSTLAYCLTMAMALSLATRQHHRYQLPSSLNGNGNGNRGRRRRRRSLEQQPPQWPRWGCPCNGTYASQACCGSLTKLVWEDPELRIPFRLAGDGEGVVGGV